MKKILIVDDHPIVRSGLNQLIRKIVEEVEIDETGLGEEALEMSAGKHYDLILLDIALPDINGLTVLAHIREKKPECPVIVLSIFPENMYALRVFKAGASGYLVKESDHTIFASAIRKVLAGGRYVSPTMVEMLVGNIQTKTGVVKQETLSDREFQIMTLIASGKKPREIAEMLCLSARTVSTYRMRILKKLCLKGNAELVQYYIQNHLSELK
ncbi:MAG: response regulator [Candidatus Xenobiia bacterium LiM19]